MSPFTRLQPNLRPYPGRYALEAAHHRRIAHAMQPKCFPNSLKIPALCLGHVDDTNGNSEEGGTAKEEVDQRRRVGE